jgi:hypothetical protein
MIRALAVQSRAPLPLLEPVVEGFGQPMEAPLHAWLSDIGLSSAHPLLNNRHPTEQHSFARRNTRNGID